MTLAESAPKVFGVGFHKTGTSSLAEALRFLGYRVTGPNFVQRSDPATSALDLALDLVPRFDAFQDNPWPMLFEELDRRFPGSRFILTVRDEGRWIASVVDHFGTETTPMRQWIYGETCGAPVGNEAVYLQRYRAHNRNVLTYFAERSDLLVMDITAGDGWGRLCEFLGCAPPHRPFPRANGASDRTGSRGEGSLARVRRSRIGRRSKR